MAYVPNQTTSVGPMETPLHSITPVLWHSPLKGIQRRENEEAKGFLADRVADRCGDHFDYRGDRNSELDSLENGRQRSICCRFAAHHQHRGSGLFQHL